MKSKEEYWEPLFKGYERSGLSQEEFCNKQGIPIAKFKGLSKNKCYNFALGAIV